MAGSATPQVSGWERVLLPTEWYETRGHSRRDRIVDAAVVLAAAAVGVAILAGLWDRRSPVASTIDLAVGSVACLSLLRRRSHPLAVGIFTTAASSVVAMANGAALVGVFNAASRLRGRGLVAVAAGGFAASAIFPLLYSTEPVLKQRFPGFLLVAIALGWGLFARARRDLIISLRDRATRLEAERERNVEQARDAERRWIAREMHDVLAHRLSLLSLQAGALELRHRATDEEVAQAAEIRTSAGAALRELRDVIAVLREDADGSLAPPQPTLRQLPGLFEESRAAGMKLQARVDVASAERLSDPLSRTAFRVVQEGLTNARKHAPNAPVRVTIAPHGASALVIEVLTRESGAPSPPTTMGSGGAGLIGLTERLAIVGGELEHGRQANNDFSLRATLPWTP